MSKNQNNTQWKKMYEEKRVGEKNLNRSVKFCLCAQKKSVKLKEFLEDSPKEFEEICERGRNYIFKFDF